MGSSDAAVVDEDVDFVVEEFGGFRYGGSDFGDGAEVAESRGKICRELSQVGVDAVVEFLFVEIDDEDSVAVLKEGSS